MIKFLISIIFVFSATAAHTAAPFDYKYYNHWKYVYHPHNESSYQHTYCALHDGIEEYELSDKTRVDCLTKDYAIEFDFANKTYEAIGQALHYSIMTNKRPKVVLILDKKYEQRQMVYFERIKRIGNIYNIEVEYVTDDILTLDKKNSCNWSDCKCHKKFFRF